jgi:hypothetical protein
MQRPPLVVLALLMAACPSMAESHWHHPLYLGNDGYWRHRVPVIVSNAGDHAVAGAPVVLTVGKETGQADLVGAAAEAVRVVDAGGAEMLFAIYGPRGETVTGGAIPDGSALVIPAECGPHASATYYVYFGNPSAWPVPDFLESLVGVRNGGVEDGSGRAPSGWVPDGGDSQHQVSWTTAHPHSGSHCLTTVVSSGAAPTWISTRQQGIHVSPGATCTLSAWVRAENVVGQAGWYLHVGNAANPMLINQVLSGGSGTYHWKQVSFTFMVPPEADRVDLGTVLYGTGAAWFDDVSLDCSSAAAVTARAWPRESLSLTESGNDAAWYEAKAGDDRQWNYRAPVKAINVSGRALPGVLVQADIGPLLTRLGARLNRNSIRVTDGATLLPSYQFGSVLCFGSDLPARGARTYFIYLSEDSRIPPVRPSGYESLLASPHDSARNASFEMGASQPDGWSANTPPGGKTRTDGLGLFGARSAVMSVPASAALGWYGWHQDVPVQPGGSYLLAGWVKTEGVTDGSVQLYAHYRNAAGELCGSKQYAAAGPPLSGSSDWTLMAGVFDMPEDCVTFQLHLTMHAHGTVSYDGIVVAQVHAGILGALQARDSGQASDLSVWPVNAIVKVFQDDPTPADISPARITAARSEREPLQLAVRSSEAIAGVSIDVVSPVNPKGDRLADVSVAVVGYVPIDHGSGYYQSRTPAWRRRYPTDPGQSDGWAGVWPDPLLSASTFSLKPGVTQPFWVTVTVPRSAMSGDYRGAVRLLKGGKVLKEVPFTVHVWDFQLPDEHHLAAIYDVRLGDLWNVLGLSAEQVNDQIRQFMSAYRVCPDAIFPEPDISYQAGRVTAEFTAFDAAAERYFGDLRFPHTYTPWFLYAFGWGLPPQEVFGEKPYEGEWPYPDADRSRLRPAYKQAYQAVLRAYWEHLKAKGWADKAVLYLSDEPFASDPKIVAQMKALCDMVHEVDPAIPVYVSTWSYVPEWQGCINVWGIGHYGIVSPEQMHQIRARGDRLRYTTDGQMCTDTPYCAIERLLPHYCFQYDVEAYEFWGFTWLTYNPHEFGWHAYIAQTDQPGSSYYVRYPNGDGFLAYPGGPVGHPGPVSSIRLEQAREGAEDYEYLLLLRDLVVRQRAAGRDATSGEAALALAKALVPIPNAGGRYSSQILPDPGQVLAVKEAVAKAIEDSLQTPP